MALQAKDLEAMQQVADFFDEIADFFEVAKKEVLPTLNAIWEHYKDNDNIDDRGHGLMLGMALKHDAGHCWSLSDVSHALKYAKCYMTLPSQE